MPPLLVCRSVKPHPPQSKGELLRTWGIPLLSALLIGGLAGWVFERPPPEVDQRTGITPSSVVVSLSRPGGVQGAVMAGLPTPLDVEVISSAPVAEIELRAGATIIDRIVLDVPLTAFTATLTWAPDDGLHVLTAQVFTTDGRSGYSNPLTLFATDLFDGLYALVEKTTDEGDTLSSIAAEFDVEIEQVQAANQGLDPDQPIPGGTAVKVPVVLTGAPEGMPPDSPFPPEIQAILDELSQPGTEPRELPDSVVAADQPSVDVEVSVRGCVATLEFDTAGMSGDVGVLRLHPPSANRVPVELEIDGSRARATHPLGAGVYDYLVELTTGGRRHLVGSARAIIDEPCGGSWTGPGKIVDGVLFLDDDTIQAAYVYLSTGSNRWGRAPAADQTAVPRGSHDGFDLNGHLPFVGDGPLEVEVWGWGPDGLYLVGNLEFQPTPGVDTSEALGAGRVSLLWIENAGGAQDALREPEVLVESGLVTDHATTLSFRWNSGIKPVTHIVWQVFPDSPPSDPSKIAPGGILVHGTSEDTADVSGAPGSVFTVDLAALMAPWYQTADIYIPNTAELTTGTTSPHSPVLQNLNIATHDEAAVAAGGVTGSASYVLWGGASSSQVGPIETPQVPGHDATARAAGGETTNVYGLGSIKVSPPKPTSLYVRALAFSGDQYLGVASNYVNILLEEIPVIEDLKPAQGSYELEIDLKPLVAADLSLEHCVQVVSWDSDAIIANAKDPEWNKEWSKWAWYWDKVGIQTPICAGCYVIDGNVGFNIGSQNCSWNNKCPALGLQPFCSLVEGAIALYDAVVQVFDYVKGVVVDVVVAISGCKQIGGVFSSDKKGVASACNGIATIAVNVVLMYFGIPPNLPSSEELVEIAKGDIKQWLVTMAEEFGIPCDELSNLDEFVDMKGLTCDGMADYIVEHTIDEALALFSKSAQASLNIPAGVKLIPATAGRLSPATVEVTVRTTEDTPSHLTMCPATLQLWSNWTPKIATPFDLRPYGAQGFFAHFEPPAPYIGGGTSYSLVPWAKYLASPYQPVTFMLPQPGSAQPGTEATTTVNLAVPNEYDWTTLWRARPSNMATSGYQWTSSEINRIHLIGHPWANVSAWVSSSCAGFAGDDSIILPHGLGSWAQ